jgi:O-antigen/teichoic acid export membrane protein
MGYEPPVLDPHGAPTGPPPERRAYVRREEDYGNLLGSAVSLLFAICGGLAVIFLFFALMGAIDLGDAVVATVIAIVMALVWFGGFYYRHRTQAGRTQWRDRERRGF